MKVDWKHLATTEGYRSLKNAVAKCTGRSKQERYALFYRVVGIALSNSQIIGLPPEHYLDAWEAKRTYWYMNFYSKHNFRQHELRYTQPLPITTIRGWKRYYSKDMWTRRDPEVRHKRIADARSRILKKDSNKERWSLARKKLAARYRKPSL